MAHVKEIWRYPVKSMGGERLKVTELTKGGIPYDRGWALRDEADQTIRGAKHFAGLLNCSARYLMDTPATPVPQAEITLPDGRRINTSDAKVHSTLSEVAGRAVTLWPLQPRENTAHYRSNAPITDIEAYLRKIFALEASEPLPDLSTFPPDVLQEITVYASPRGTYFDAFPVNVLTEASLRYMKNLLPDSLIDVRRFRPNFLTADDNAPAAPVEFDWVGREVGLGGARIAAIMRCPRCIMTTRAQERHDASLPRDSAIMRALVRETAQNLSIYATVTKEGAVAVGDAVTVG
ncbi:MAG: MOSC domain-containing protein [Alphaproteobacteria bacterium]|nr:MOSC domain-containing protein [Alphaproteobacteria bacterium]